MAKSVFTGAHQHLVDVLVETRKAAGLRQVDLAVKVGKDQTYISLIERSQRRVDVLEFVALAMAMGADPVKLFAKVVKRMPDRVEV